MQIATINSIKDMRNAIDAQMLELKQIALSAKDPAIVKEVQYALDWIKEEANHAKFELKITQSVNQEPTIQAIHATNQESNLEVIKQGLREVFREIEDTGR